MTIDSLSYKIKKSKIKGAGKGLFATVDFCPAEKIGNFEVEYAHEENKYTYYYEDIKVNVTNELKYANHSKNPNAVIIGLDMYAIKTINKGEEITWHYGEDWK